MPIYYGFEGHFAGRTTLYRRDSIILRYIIAIECPSCHFGSHFGQRICNPL